MTSSINSDSTQKDLFEMSTPKGGKAATAQMDDYETYTQEANIDVERADNTPTPAISRRSAILLFVGLAMATFLASLDGTIIATALPKIASDFKAQSQMSWVATAYLLTYNSFQPLYGKFSDIFGRKIMILFASVAFMIGSAGAGGAQSMTMLIGFRAIQGLGGSGLMSVVLIIISDIFPLEERPKYQSIVWSVFGVSSVIGPLLGGRQELKKQLSRIDYAGTFFIIVAVVCLLLPITWGGTTYPWKSAQVISLFVVAAVLIVILIWVEFRATEAIIPPRLFANKTVTVLFLVNFLTGMSFLGVIFYAPIYFQVVKAASATASGLHLLPMVLGLVFASIISGALLSKIPDYRVFIWIGTILMSVGTGLCILFDADSGMGPQIGYLLIVGCGIGCILQTCMLAAQAAVDKEDMAVVTALCGFFNSIGGGIGIAMCSSLFNNRLTENFAKLPMDALVVIAENNIGESITAVQSLPEPVKGMVIAAYVNGFQFIFKCITPIACVAFLMSLFIRKLRMLDPSEVIMGAA
ncbi:hypothetical protein BGZ80_003459 [Entomortierella chlamydospora]|uniref:Major facilitator superfamily (MFS) profile domain-containing protein n=1 Tax=Entomortierella chlamydospora TaxID=101097 RepID=A0A9P6MNZ2_9FUNG|nr:hypothetical protein BGZ80_003459 [Entomortierella chlamydospora]